MAGLQNLAMPSSGDDAADADELRRFYRRELRMEEGFCPNEQTHGDVELVPDPDDPRGLDRLCPDCGFAWHWVFLAA